MNVRATLKQPVTGRTVYLIVTIYVTFLFFGIAGILYTNYVARQSEQRNQERARDFCGVVVLIDDRQQKITKPSPDQKVFIDEMHKYRIKLGC